MTLGHKIIGSGTQRVVVLNDWMGDHRNYDPMLPYLDQHTFSYAFADLRGYGLSRELHGSYTLAEAAADVLALAKHLDWPRFHLIGHSMSSLVAQQVAANAKETVASLVLLCPIPPSGMAAPPEVVFYLEHIAIQPAMRRDALAQQWGARLSPQWLDFKLKRWADSALPQAVKGYVQMFAATSLADTPRKELPVLAVVGDADNEPFTQQTAQNGLASYYSRLTINVCANAGHYPMQETPVALATLVENFLRAN